MAETIKPAGRKPHRGPTPYDPDRHPSIVFALAAVGKTDEEIAYYLQVTPSTLSRWKYRHKSIEQALTDANRGVDKEIENALAKAALGIESTSESVRGTMGKDGKMVPTDATTAKSKTPSVAAMIFWLKNRRPDIWRDTFDHTTKGKQIESNCMFYLPAKTPMPDDP